LRAVLFIPKNVLEQMVCHCLDGYPLEACGLLGGVEPEPGNAHLRYLYPGKNAASSARVYEIEPQLVLRSGRDLESHGSQLLGVYHSHTHTEAKPSPTDVAQAPDPSWHYVLVSLRDTEPSVRSWMIRDGKIQEEPVVLQW
jgi:proteasome lid subunit RPN8/RPN11